MRPLVITLVLTTYAMIPGTASFAGQAPADTRTSQPDHAFLLGGWTRTSVEVISPAARDRGDEARGIAVPHDKILARQLLQVRARYSRGAGFEAVGSALVTVALARPSGLPGNDAVSSETGVNLREAYVGFPAGDLNIRAGLQRIAWGHGDLMSPNDVVNANDLRDPILNENELTHVPTLAMRVDVELRSGSLQLVVEPLFEPDAYETYGSNWAFVQPGAPPGYRGLLRILSGRPDVSHDDAGTALLVTGPRPRRLSAVEGGARFDWRTGRVDVSHYYHYGYQGTPKFRVAPSAVAALDSIDWSSTASHEAGRVVSELTGAVGSSWQRRHHIGLDVGTTAGPFVLRLDTAYQDQALFYDPTFNGWAAAAIETVAGIEYQHTDIRRTILLETRYRRILKNVPATGLLYVAQDSIDAAVLGRWTFARTELEVRAAGGLHPRSFVLRPQIAWRHRAFTVRAGVVVPSGEDRSFGGWYRRNRSTYLMLRKDF